LNGPLRIAFLDSWWRTPERGSGTTVGIAGLAEGLRSLGHQVTVVGPRWGTPGHLATRLLFNLEAPSRLRSGRFDLVVGFDWDGWTFRPPPGSAYVACLKGVVADEARFERGLPRALLRVQASLEARNARRAPRVVTTSRYSRARLCDAYRLAPAAVAVVPEGIDLALWRGPGPRPADPRPTILSVARQYPRKNTRTLLAALPAVRRAVPDVALRVVGDGPELPALRRLAGHLGLSDCVTFLGALPDGARVREEYARARLFCLPSLQEGFGIVYLEAMAAGLPVVAGNAAAVAETVADGEAGLLVPPRDPGALARALVALLTDAALGRRMGAAGRKRAQGYAWPTVARRFLREVEA
jgi:glycosyltransferase involved in cell wall biosynthesis